MEKLCASFKLFDLSHLVYLGLSVVVSVALVLLLRKQSKNVTFYSAKILVGASAVFLVLGFVGRLMNGDGIIQSIPLSCMGIFVIIAIYVEIKQSESWIKFGYFVALPISVVSLFVVPNYFCVVGAATLPTISYFLINMLLSAYWLLKALWSNPTFKMKDILNVSTNFVIILAFVHIFNVIAQFTTLNKDANYLGTMGESYSVVLDLLFSWIPMPLAHLLPLITLLVGVEFLLFLPFDLLKNRKERRAHIEELVALGNLKAQQEARMNSRKPTSQILVRSEEKARPEKEKNVYNRQQSDGFLSVNKEVQVNRDDKN